MKIKDVSLAVYSPGEEKFNIITHCAGFILPVLIMTMCFPRALSTGNAFYIICSLLYASGTAVMFAASVFYHAAKDIKIKKAARLIDYSAVFIAVAATVSGCVPIVYFQGFRINAVLMLITAWSCVIAGFIFTWTDFEKFRTLRMVIYAGCAAVCAVLGAKSYFHLPPGAFMCFLFGSAGLIISCVLLRAGAKRKYLHGIFHIFVLIGLGIYYTGIYKYVFCLIK